MAPMHAPAPTRAHPTPPSARRAAATIGGAPPRGAFHERLEQYVLGAAAPFSCELDLPGMYADPHMHMHMHNMHKHVHVHACAHAHVHLCRACLRAQP